MALGDAYISCDNRELSLEDLFRQFLIIEGADGKPCLKVCGIVTESGGAQGNPDIDQFVDASGTVSGAKSMTFAWTGDLELDGIILSDDFSPISFSDDNGLGSMTWDNTIATVGAGAGTLTILTIV